MKERIVKLPSDWLDNKKSLYDLMEPYEPTELEKKCIASTYLMSAIQKRQIVKFSLLQKALLLGGSFSDGMMRKIDKTEAGIMNLHLLAKDSSLDKEGWISGIYGWMYREDPGLAIENVTWEISVNYVSYQRLKTLRRYLKDFLDWRQKDEYDIQPSIRK